MNKPKHLRGFEGKAIMVSKIETLELMGRAPLFGTLDETARQAVLGEMREAQFDAGQLIFSRGDQGTDIHLVTKGRVRLSVLTADGRELSFAHAEAGSIFGEIAVFDGGTRSADATAVGRVQTLTLSKSAFTRLLAARPQVAEAAIKFLSQRLRVADEQLEAIALHPIEGRLARFFLGRARQTDPSSKAAHVTLSVPISQSELALLVGASRPKVNAALALLESEGAITRRGTDIICDVAALGNIGGVD